mmetsp:Transcript_13894/g.39184  ORF Transcript_13894/g.39184 Transcript_13894/m.39184 type:complete len:234 (+) Transcript_13894:3683-4384(+)
MLRFVVPRQNDAVLVAGHHSKEPLHELYDPFSPLDVPEGQAVVRSLRPVVRVHHRPVHIAPGNRGFDVGKVHEGVDCHRDPEPRALPRQRADASPRNSQRLPMVSHVRIERHHGRWPGLRCHVLLAKHGQNRPRGIPLDPVDLHLRVHDYRLIVVLVLHELHPPGVRAQRENGNLVILGYPFPSRVPIDPNDVVGQAPALQLLGGQLGDGVAIRIVDVALPVRGAEQDHPGIR